MFLMILGLFLFSVFYIDYVFWLFKQRSSDVKDLNEFSEEHYIKIEQKTILKEIGVEEKLKNSFIAPEVVNRYLGIKSFINSNWKTLEVGCRAGDGTQLLNIKNLVGVDLSNLNLQVFKRRGLGEAFILNAGNLPFKDNSFDLCLCLESIEHFVNAEKAVNEMKRVAKRVLISQPNPSYCKSINPFIFLHLLLASRFAFLIPFKRGAQIHNFGYTHHFLRNLTELKKLCGKEANVFTIGQTTKGKIMAFFGLSGTIIVDIGICGYVEGDYPEKFA